jgi:hypothetical protein
MIYPCTGFDDEAALTDQETAATLLMLAEAGCTLDEART